MQCPIDQSPLVHASFGSKNLHRCNRCFGSFVPANTFSELRAVSAMQMHLQSKDGHVHLTRSDGQILICPCHDAKMQTFFFKGVEIDICPQCSGVWLDQGELQKVSDLVQVAKAEDLSSIGQHKGSLTYDRKAVDGLDVFVILAEFIEAIAPF